MTPTILSKICALACVLAIPLALSCSKDDADTQSTHKEVDFDDSEPPPGERKPVPGVVLSELEKPLAARFDALIDKLASPCGKAHSLRTSRNEDDSCKRASFAVEYTFELIKDGATDSELKSLYADRFGKASPSSFSLDPSHPHSGPTDAAVKVVEFYDYGCPACARFVGILKQATQGLETEVVVYYKQFPLSAHKDSPGAAQAALAAHKQGKFSEMHALLFQNQHSHKVSDLKGYGGIIGLDMAQWDADYKSAASQVESDQSEGAKVGVSSTPAIYINGRLYAGPADAKYFKMWLDEALALAI